MKYILFAVSLSIVCASCVQSPPTKDQLSHMSVEEIHKQTLKLWKDGEFSDPSLAIEYANAAIAKNPKYGRAYYAKGFAHYNLQENELAIENFSKAIEIDPHIQETYNGRGWVYLETKQYHKAIQDFTQSISIDNTYALPVNNRGYAYLQLNNYEKACIDLKRACTLGSCKVYYEAKNDNKCK